MPEANWQTCTLGSIRDSQPRTINPADFVDEEFEYYSIPDYQDRGLPSVTLGSEIESNKLLLPEQCVLFGKLNPRVEKVWMTSTVSELRMLGSTEWLPIKPRTDYCPEFVYYLCWSSQVMPKAKQMVSGSTPSRQRVDPSAFYRIEVTIPAKEEQRQIARVLATVQRAIAQQQAIIAITRELKRSLMHKLFTEGLRGEAQKPTEIGLVPESWEVKRIGEIATLKSGGTPSRTNEAFWKDGTIPWVKTGEVDYRVIDDTEEKITQAGLEGSSAKIFPAGTLLMAMYGQGITRGKVGILGVDAATNQACVAFFPENEVRTGFLYQLFTFKYDYIRNLGHGANQKNLSADILKTVQIAYPKEIDEQDEIVASLSALDDKLALSERKRAHYADLFKTLLHQLMTAQIRVNDLDLDALGVPTLD